MENNPAHTQIQDLFSKVHAANDKFDYFICTVAGGLFAYIGENFSPDKLTTGAAAITFIALLFLAISFWCGLKRIQIMTAFNLTNRKLIQCEEMIAKAVFSIKQYTEAQKPGGENSLGEYFTVSQLQERRIGMLKNREEIKELLTKHNKYARRFGVERDALLVIGFILLLSGKCYQWLH
jgi:hypothetical protein